MKINLKDYVSIETHLAAKKDNHGWIQECLEGRPEAFPHRVKEDGKASLDNLNYAIGEGDEFMPRGSSDGAPAYLVNIPVARSGENIARLLSLFIEEAFGANRAESKVEIKKRVAVVLGINRAISLDPSVNGEFIDHLDRIEKVKGIAYRVVAFFWKPEWEKTKQEPRIYSAEKGYLILKALLENSPKAVLTYAERHTGSQVPFQLIRERIKEISSSNDFPSGKSYEDHFQEVLPNSPHFLVVMDADTLALRVNGRGAFSRVDKVISEKNPSVVTTGYRLKQEERILLRIGVKLDMAVRAAMTKVVPYSAYIPEPNAFFRFKKPNEQSNLSRLSFVKKGSRTLESRRFIQNGMKKHLLDNRVVFLAVGGVVTETPDRMKTKKNEKIQQFRKEKRILQALRDVSQTHATPKQWADNLYGAIGFSYRQVTDVTGPMMHIFGVFDPISRMYAVPGRFNSSAFDQVIGSYGEELTENQKNVLVSAKQQLTTLGMPAEKISLVEKAAIASGKAIHQILSSLE